MADWILFPLVGLAAGWLATRIMKHRDLDLAGNLVLGILGAIVGGIAFRILGFGTQTWVAALICATLGAMAMIWLVRFLNRK